MYLLTSSEVLKQYDFMNLPAVLIILIPGKAYNLWEIVLKHARQMPFDVF
jgi:hypothetical protein